MSWAGRIRNALRPGRVDREINKELAFHLTERIEELQAAGLNETEAVRTAQRQIGNRTYQTERTRDVNIDQRVEAALRNLRHAARGLRQAPGFTATVTATLALGIGANSAVFSAIWAVVLRPLPFPHAERLVTVEQVNPKAKQPFVAPVRLADWNRLNTTFQSITGYYMQDDSELSGELPERLKRAFVAPRFLETWGIAPAIGRDFRPEEHSPAQPTVLISDRLGRRRFNADANVLGKKLRFAGFSSEIIGVMPASFTMLRGVDLYSPSPLNTPFAQQRTLTWFRCVGRLKPGASIEQGRANLAAVQAALGREFPKPDAEIGTAVAPLRESTLGGARKSLWVLFGSVSLLLLTACTNVAALLLSRGAARQREIAVRFSLGATRGSVAAHLLTEVLLLAVGGAAVGLLLAAVVARVFRTLAKDLPRVDEIALDWRLVAYTLGCAVAATFLCGLIPALRSTRRDLAAAARTGRGSVSGGGRVQFALVGVQVALAVTLLAGAGLLIRSLQQLGRVSPGFSAGQVVSFQMSSSWSETGDRAASKRKADRILERLAAVPGVEAVGEAYTLPGVPTEFQVEFTVAEGRSATEPKVIAEGRGVSPTYFATMQIPLFAGEICRDDSSVRTAMVNRAFANAYFAGRSPVGLHIAQQGNLSVPPSEIRGVVGDAREMGIDKEAAPTVYWCVTFIQPGTHFLARVRGNSRAIGETIRRAMREVEPNRSVYDVAALEDSISDAYGENRLRTVLLASFAAAAILLACVGLYGTISYTVNVRRREVGLRLALGAMRTQVAGQFVGSGMAVAGVGCAAGLGMSVAFTRLLSGMLYGVSPTDPATLAAVAVGVLGVSAAAALVPAVRAARLEPMAVLRDE
jgi:putative ABC transport system permease protein